MPIATLYVPCSSPEEASDIARTTLEERLAACANIIPETTSIYHWNEQLKEASESLLLLKTRPELIAPLTARIRELHSYECPCITAWTSTEGNEDYFHWVFNETRPASPSPPSPPAPPECHTNTSDKDEPLPPGSA